MAFKTFNRKQVMSFRDFISHLKNGERDLHKLLGTEPGDFNDASFEQLMSNPDDVIRRVNRVQMNFKKIYFGIFDKCLIKHNDDGDVKFTFYTFTNDVPEIKMMATTLLELLGVGFFDSKQYSSFRDEDKIHAIASGRYVLAGDEPGQHWLIDGGGCSLHYLSSPSRQFMFEVTLNAPRQADLSVRRKGTILDLLKLNVENLLATEPIHDRQETVGGKIKFIDYTYHLKEKEFDIFNVAQVRIFSDKRKFDKFVQTHLTLYTIGEADADKKIDVVEKLLRIYGLDHLNSGELEFFEKEAIESGDYWLGRTWQFNESHAPWTINSSHERMSYEVRVDNTTGKDSFKISISCYDKLVSLFDLS